MEETGYGQCEAYIADHEFGSDQYFKTGIRGANVRQKWFTSWRLRESLIAFYYPALRALDYLLQDLLIQHKIKLGFPNYRFCFCVSLSRFA